MAHITRAANLEASTPLSRQPGGDPGEKCFALARKDNWRNKRVVCWGQKTESP